VNRGCDKPLYILAFHRTSRDGSDALSAATLACETAARSVAVSGAMEAPVSPLDRAGR
jgi:hypothetical protein